MILTKNEVLVEQLKKIKEEKRLELESLKDTIKICTTTGFINGIDFVIKMIEEGEPVTKNEDFETKLKRSLRKIPAFQMEHEEDEDGNNQFCIFPNTEHFDNEDYAVITIKKDGSVETNGLRQLRLTRKDLGL